MRHPTTSSTPSTRRSRVGRIARTGVAVIGVASLGLACSVEDQEPGDPGVEDPAGGGDIGG